MDILTKLKKRTGETDEYLLAVLLDDAKNAILSRRFPFGDYPVNASGETVIEDRYLDLQYRIAVDLYNKQGAEGQTVHKENGIDRTFQNAWISEQLLSEVIPYCGVTT